MTSTWLVVLIIRTPWMKFLEYLFSFAALDYTVVIWLHLLVFRKVRSWMMRAFELALFCDIFATFFLCVWNSKGWEWTGHNVFGTLAPILMLVHYLFMRRSVGRGEESSARFLVFSVSCWIVWMASIITGFALIPS